MTEPKPHSQGGAAATAHTPPGVLGVRLGPTPAVSLVLAWRGTDDALAAALRPLVRQCAQASMEVIVARACDPTTPRALEEEYPTVTFVRGAADTPLAELRRLGAVEARGEVLLLADDQRPVPDGRIADISEAFDERARGASGDA